MPSLTGADIRQMHARHLAFLREGLLIADRDTAVLVKDILDTCKRFAGLVDRWGGDVLPELLSDDDSAVEERTRVVDEISEVRSLVLFNIASSMLIPDTPRTPLRTLPPPPRLPIPTPAERQRERQRQRHRLRLDCKAGQPQPRRLVAAGYAHDADPGEPVARAGARGWGGATCGAVVVAA